MSTGTVAYGEFTAVARISLEHRRAAAQRLTGRSAAAHGGAHARPQDPVDGDLLEETSLRVRQ